MKERTAQELEYIKELWFVISDELKIIWYLEKVWLHRLSI